LDWRSRKKVVNGGARGSLAVRGSVCSRIQQMQLGMRPSMIGMR
jgi:hypothetical protein